MPRLTLDGDTLGEKHKNLNKLVQDAVAKKDFNLTKIDCSSGDIDNLIKIDIANKTKNVEYILEVLKCDDMLYVSRAIKRSRWLITEKQYTHLMNPKYLYTQLFPHMLTCAINKLLLNIRLHLQDEERVEAFYDYLKALEKPNKSDKWLLNCSIPFTEKVIQDHTISLQLYKRLCKRSVKFLPYYTKIESNSQWRALKAVLFLLKSNTEEYLNVMETMKESYFSPSFGKKYTDIVMKKCPNRILDNFETYSRSVDLSVVAKLMKKEDIEGFVLKYVNNSKTKYVLTNYESLKHFIENVPEKERFQFVKKIYIDKDNSAGRAVGYSSDCVESWPAAAFLAPLCNTNIYNWYQYAPFSVALIELEKMIRAESSPSERCIILSVLTICARKKSDYKTLLQFYYDKHRNEPFRFKLLFVNLIIKHTRTNEFDRETWNILDKLFYSLGVYSESEFNDQTYLKNIVLYKVLHDETVPEIVEKKITFDSFKKYQRQLNKEQQNKLFSYLLTSISGKIQNKTIATESDFSVAFNLLENALNLLSDWKKDIKEHPFLLNKIRELTKLKNENSWSLDLTSIYTINKSWRKQMFEESMTLRPSEEVCLNALKHDTQLLTRHSAKVDELRTNDAVSLQRVLAKLRIYWANSLAQQWTDAYLSNLNKTTGHKALIKGLFRLLPKERVLDLAKKYVPQEAAIDWSEIDQTELALRKNIAKNLYITRPLISLETALWYAKGDYLQFAVSSLNSIIHNISKVQSQGHMIKLLEAPVSLQKFGLHLAFIKLTHEELKPIFAGIWKTTKNSTIRTHLFTHTFNMMCKAKEPSHVKDLWDLLSMFIDNLSTEENKIIYGKLGNVKDVPKSILREFFPKAYNILASLPAGANCENHKDNLINNSFNFMELLDGDFVANKMIAGLGEKLTSKSRCQFIELMVSYVLHGRPEEEQCERFKKVIVPVLELAFASWETVKDEEFVAKENVDTILKTFIWGVRKSLPVKKIIVPVKLFWEIEQFLNAKLSKDENYVRLTFWTLATEYVKLIADQKDIFVDPKLEKVSLADYGKYWLPDEVEHLWEALHLKISPVFGPVIVKHLKGDTEKYDPTICSQFGEALSVFFQRFNFQKKLMKMETLKDMVVNDNFVPSFIVVCDQMPIGNDDEKKTLTEVLKVLSAHPSLEVKLHYKKAFENVTDPLL